MGDVIISDAIPTQEPLQQNTNIDEKIDNDNGMTIELKQELNDKRQQILNELGDIKGQISSLNTRIDNLGEKMDTGFNDVNKRLDELPKEIASTLSSEVIPVLSDKLHDIKTEVSIIKSSVGEHEMDIKYLKKVK